MEVTHHRRQEEKVVEQLGTWLPDHTATSGNNTSSSSDIDGISSKPSYVMNNGYNSKQEVDENGISEKSVYFDKNEGTTLQWCLLGNNLRVEDVDIPKLVNAVINNLGNVKEPTSGEEENIGTGGGVNENVRIDLMEESDEEVIELEIERAVEKVHAHTAYCPNCCSQISKVILRGRKREDRVPSIADSSSDIDGIGSKPSNVMTDGYNCEQEVDKNDILELNIYFDNNEGITLQWPLSGNNLRVEDLDMPKLVNDLINNLGNVKEEIVSALISPTLKPTSKEDENIGTRGRVNENVRIEQVEESDESDEEVIELEFERAVEKVRAHTAYCPNCSSRITKVILRRSKREDSVQPIISSHHRDKPVDLFGCLSCFSIFIPSGSAFDLFRTFRKRIENKNPQDSQGNDQVKRKGESNNQEENSLDNLTGALPGSSCHVLVLNGSPSSGHTIEKEDNASSETGESQIPRITPTHVSVPSEAVAIDIGDGIDGISDGVTAPRKPESVIREKQSAKSQGRPVPDEESPVKTETFQHGETVVNAGNDQVKHEGESKSLEYGKAGFCSSQITKLTLRLRKTGRQVSVYCR